ncbi:MAG: FxsA family protein [Micrococcales bacterium]|uniref:FxsA family protein n=1 Tax=Phycicoccus sp. TaxID=1902410 RepID=UPI00199873DF|nr:FxsA family protein [Phycicoccus sp.]MBD3783843.1 FxsA family protein [Micrococcales bacterium]HMM94806.1 FxsA family protein [Phycicoccus sp.]
MTAAGDRRPGGRRRALVLRGVFLALLVVPLLEIAVIVLVGRAIGGWPTFLLLLLESLLGAWIVKREGGRAWAALRGALRSGTMPSRELADAALVLVGGTLLLTPGFVTDVVGFLVILPWTRPITRAWLEAAVARRLLGPFGDWPGPRGGGGGRNGDGPPDVVRGEVVE